VTDQRNQGQKTSAAWNATLYDTKHDFVWKYGSDLIALLAPQPGERILDLGCGTGHLSAQIAETCAQVVGVDRSEEMIDAARKAYMEGQIARPWKQSQISNLKFEIADAVHLPFENEFDAVFSNAALHWIHEPAAVLRGVHRALRPGGRFVAEFGGRGNVSKIVAAMDDMLIQVQSPHAGKVHPWYFPSPGEYSVLLEAEGFEVRWITLFDRPTVLSDGESGLRNWIVMFCSDYLTGLDEARREGFLARVEDALRPKLFRSGEWVADYRRLRVMAVK
jgi:ubiquinone/menaquinone biosynthesis C-methylase UbiE